MSKRGWDAFTGITSHSYVRDQMDDARHISPLDLYDMAKYQREERLKACNGYDPIRIIVAYAQEDLVYDAKGHITKVDDSTYSATPRENKINKFALAYREDAKLYLHKVMADITVAAAIDMYKTHGWDMVLYDGLRTVDGAYALYQGADEADMECGLLSLPGRSSHNKGMAIDSMMEDRNGNEIDVGGHFDHLDMEVNSRLYHGPKLSEAAQRNRLIREAAFQRAALSQGMLLAPLRSEFWHDQTPENREDLWRVLESVARCLGMRLLDDDDERLRKTDRKSFIHHWEEWDYAEFCARWKTLFAGREGELVKILGTDSPPAKEKPEFYHGNYHPVYDASLRASGKHLTDWANAA